MYRDFSHSQYHHDHNDRSNRKVFPVLLHEFISDPQNCSIITWIPHGRAFKLLSRDKFESRSNIDSNFKLKKATSLIRQINGWGFHRVTRGIEKGSYYHEVRMAQFMN